jgi:hypothetical protein
MNSIFIDFFNILVIAICVSRMQLERVRLRPAMLLPPFLLIYPLLLNYPVRYLILNHSDSFGFDSPLNQTLTGVYESLGLGLRDYLAQSTLIAGTTISLLSIAISLRARTAAKTLANNQSWFEHSNIFSMPIVMKIGLFLYVLGCLSQPLGELTSVIESATPILPIPKNTILSSFPLCYIFFCSYVLYWFKLKTNKSKPKISSFIVLLTVLLSTLYSMTLSGGRGGFISLCILCITFFLINATNPDSSPNLPSSNPVLLKNIKQIMVILLSWTAVIYLAISSTINRFDKDYLQSGSKRDNLAEFVIFRAVDRITYTGDGIPMIISTKYNGIDNLPQKYKLGSLADLFLLLPGSLNPYDVTKSPTYDSTYMHSASKYIWPRISADNNQIPTGRITESFLHYSYPGLFIFLIVFISASWISSYFVLNLIHPVYRSLGIYMSFMIIMPESSIFGTLVAIKPLLIVALTLYLVHCLISTKKAFPRPLSS